MDSNKSLNNNQDQAAYSQERHIMRFDKFTTKFQQAIADAQSMALGNDNGFICLLYTSPSPRDS